MRQLRWLILVLAFAADDKRKIGNNTAYNQSQFGSDLAKSPLRSNPSIRVQTPFYAESPYNSPTVEP